MIRLARLAALLGILTVVLALASGTALACPSCYGAADSSRFDGMNAAILAMVGITGVVLAGVGSFFIFMRKRMRRLHMAAEGSPSVDARGKISWTRS